MGVLGNEQLAYFWGKIKTLVTSKMSAYLPLSGGTMSGELKIKYGTYPKITLFSSAVDRMLMFEYNGSAKYLQLVNANAASDNQNRTAIVLYREVDNLPDLLQLQVKKSGSSKLYKIFGEHNTTASTTSLAAGTMPLSNGEYYEIYE